MEAVVSGAADSAVEDSEPGCLEVDLGTLAGRVDVGPTQMDLGRRTLGRARLGMGLSCCGWLSWLGMGPGWLDALAGLVPAETLYVAE